MSSFSKVLLELEHSIRGSLRPHDAQVVLILAYMPALGYAVQMTPVYEALTRGGYRVLVASSGSAAELLHPSPQVEHVFQTPDPMRDLPGAVLALRRQLRALGLRPGAVLTGPQDARTRIGLLGALACAGWRGGYAVHPWLYRAPLTYDRSLSRAASNLRLADLLGAATQGCEPRVYCTSAQAAAARALLPPGPLLAVIAGNSGGLPTGWHDDRWASALRHAHDRLGYHPVFLGTAQDAPLIERIRGLTGGLGTSLAGRTGIGELTAVLAQSDLCLSIMTGSLHVARAVGTPTLALGLAWEPLLEWMSPPQAHVRVLRGPDAPRRPDYRLDDLAANRVIAELTSLATDFPPSADARATRTGTILQTAETAA